MKFLFSTIFIEHIHILKLNTSMHKECVCCLLLKSYSDECEILSYQTNIAKCGIVKNMQIAVKFM